MSLRNSVLTGVSAIALSLGLSYSAQADLVLPVTNLTFNEFTGTFTPVKTLFTTAAPTNWAIGTTTGVISNLIGVGEQGSETVNQGVYAVYNGTGFTNKFPGVTPAVNFYQADGNPQFESTITQTIPGLVAGTTYDLSFQQAAGQQTGFSGATTEQWKVYLGLGGISTTCPTPNPPGGICTINGTTGNLLENSPLMMTPSQGNTDWNPSGVLTFTPTSADLIGGGTTGSAVLTFLAWGNGGSDVNEPPTVFLEGVNTPPTVPEPATLSLLGVGLLGLGAFSLRRRAKRNAAA
jgi:PEP-CTERM motif